MKKTAIIAISALIVLIIAAFAFFGGADEDVSEIKTAAITKGDLRIEVLANGVVTPDVEVVVKSKAGGEITSFPHNEGDKIKKASVVVTLDPRTERARANQAQANLLMAKARLDKAKVSLKDSKTRLERQKKLYADGIISKQELDDSEIAFEKAVSDVNIAEAEIIQTKEALNEANERLEDTEIKAPFTGTILKKYVDVGQVISSTLSSASEGTPIFSIADLDYIFINATVDEVDIAGIAPGQEVVAAVDSISGKTFAAAVERIAPQGRVDRTVTVFDVTIEVSDSEKALLRPGMTADVRILTALVKDVLLVPNEALKTNGDQTGVYTNDGPTPAFVPVKTGKTDGLMTEIEAGDGLKEGTMVVTTGWPKKNGKKAKKRFFF